MNGWLTIIGSLAALALILVSIALVLQAVVPSQAIKLVAGIIAATLLLIFVPVMIINSWDALPIWQKIAISCLALAVALRRKVRLRRRSIER